MKQAVFILLILLAGISQVSAQEAFAATTPSPKHFMLRGMIKSVSWADPVKGTESEIIVVDAGRKKTKILVAPTTTLWDAEAKAIMPDKIVPKKMVSVVYFTTDEGVHLAKSIKILQ